MSDIQDADAPAANRAKNASDGFLPIHTNAFDRIFIAIVAFVALHLLWMRFLEAEVSLYVATAISLVLGWFIITRG
jgi:predicted small integral membrane protein